MAKKSKKRNAATVVLAAFLIIAVYSCITLISQQFEITQTQKQITSLDSRIQQETLLQEDLKIQQERVNTPEYIEKTARDELDFAAPDEIVFIDATSDNVSR